MPQYQGTYLGPVTMSETEINESTLRNNPHFFFERFQVGVSLTKCFGLGLEYMNICSVY